MKKIIVMMLVMSACIQMMAMVPEGEYERATTPPTRGTAPSLKRFAGWRLAESGVPAGALQGLPEEAREYVQGDSSALANYQPYDRAKEATKIAFWRNYYSPSNNHPTEALFNAVREGILLPSFYEELIAKGADIKALSRIESMEIPAMGTVLHMIADSPRFWSHGRIGLIRLMLRFGADVNVQDSSGSTALLHLAGYRGKTSHSSVEEMPYVFRIPDVADIAFLLSQGANPYITNDEGLDLFALIEKEIEVAQDQLKRMDEYEAYFQLHGVMGTPTAEDLEWHNVQLLNAAHQVRELLKRYSKKR